MLCIQVLCIRVVQSIVVVVLLGLGLWTRVCLMIYLGMIISLNRYGLRLLDRYSHLLYRDTLSHHNVRFFGSCNCSRNMLLQRNQMWLNRAGNLGY